MTAPPSGAVPRLPADSLLYGPVRLSILAVLNRADRAEFSFLREAADVSDATLSKQLRMLEDAGYIDIEKGYVGRRPRTWASIRPAGRTALVDFVSAVTGILQ